MPRIALDPGSRGTGSAAPSNPRPSAVRPTSRRTAAAAIALLSLGGLAISWNLFLHDLLTPPPALTDKDLWKDGVAPTPEQEQKNLVLKQRSQEQIDAFIKKNGGGGP